MDYRRRENRIRYKKYLMKQKQKMKRSACKFSLALIITSLMAAVLIPSAYIQRGYFAVGGEWLLLGVIFTAVYVFTYN